MIDREQIIRMARDQGLPETEITGIFIVNQDDLGRFAEFVRKDYSFTHAQTWLKRFDDAIKTAVEREREAMLDLVDSYAKNNTDLRDAIRARGETSSKGKA